MSPLALILGIAGVVVFAYWNSFGGVFHFDDFNVIIGNPAVHSWQAWLGDAPSGIRPVLKFTYMLNWFLGVGVFGFHLVNTLVHAINAILIYHLSMRLLKDNRYDYLKGAALASALVFALHPVQTEAVTYISGRSTSLMATFYLGSLLAYVHGRRHDKSWWIYLASPLLFATAVLTKETAVVLPIAILLWDRLCESERDWRVTLRKQAAHWILLAVMAFGAAAHKGYQELFAISFGIRGLQENLLSQINGIYYLVSRLFLVNSLNIDPDLPIVSEWSLLLIVKAALLSGLVVIGLVSLKRRPSLGFGLVWFFLHLIPTNSFVPRMDIANDRQLYLASWGIFLALCVEAEMAGMSFQAGRILFRAGVVILSLVLCFFTIERNQVFQSEVALWEDTASKSPNKARVHNNLGYAYYLAGRFDEARNAYLAALQLKPEDQLARNNMAILEKVSLPNKGSGSTF